VITRLSSVHPRRMPGKSRLAPLPPQPISPGKQPPRHFCGTIRQNGVRIKKMWRSARQTRTKMPDSLRVPLFRLRIRPVRDKFVCEFRGRMFRIGGCRAV